MAVTLVSAMAVSSLAACSSSSDTGASSGATEDSKADGSSDAAGGDESNSADGSDVADAAKMEAPSTEGWDDSKKIYAYCWDSDFQTKLNLVLDANPQYKDYVEIVVTGQSGTGAEYKTTVDTAFQGGDKYPSLVAADNDVAKYWSEDSSKTVALSDIGLTAEMYANAYPFASEYGTYDGKLTCMTWQATPGSVYYNREIAKEVFGTDDPDEVQELLKDWDTFFDTADKLKEKGYYIVSGADDVKYAIWDSEQKSAWVTDKDGTETLTLDNAVNTYLETAKKLYDGGYVDTTSKLWEDPWNANMDGKAFCYFACPWFKDTIVKGAPKIAEAGGWGACAGPASYHWGGTYVMVGKDTPNPELAAYLMYELCCDADMMYTISDKTGDFVNNQAAVEKLIADGKGAQDFLGGQNPFSVWNENAKTLSLKNVTYSDSSIKSYIDKASEGYNNGTYKTIDDAIQFIKDQAKTELGLAVE